LVRAGLGIVTSSQLALTRLSYTPVFGGEKVVFLKISQELRTKDYYSLFKIHTLKYQKSSTGQFENSFDFDLQIWNRI
jgi:hypothetical protein